ncbi:MAG: hypothetical protein ACK4V2_03680 [Pseudomonadota bacterium]|nr:hypothetical protein [Alphaproteobacteria bacterium]
MAIGPVTAGDVEADLQALRDEAFRNPACVTLLNNVGMLSLEEMESLLNQVDVLIMPNILNFAAREHFPPLSAGNM